MGRPKWFKVVIVVGVAVVVAIAAALLVSVLKPPVVGSGSQPTSSAPHTPASTPTVGSSQAPAPKPLPSVDVPVEPAIPTGQVMTTDPVEFGVEFARVWMAPSPASFDHATYQAFIDANFRSHPFDDTITTDARNNITAWQVTSTSWDAMAGDGTVQKLEVAGAGIPSWVSETEVGREATAALRDAGYGEVFLVEVRGNILSSTTSSGDVMYEARALFGVLCDEERGCALGDVLTPLYDQPRFAEVAGELR